VDILQGVLHRAKVGGEKRIVRFYNNKQTNKQAKIIIVVIIILIIIIPIPKSTRATNIQAVR